MSRKTWRLMGLTALVALALQCAIRAELVHPTDEGNAADFKSKTVDMKENSKFAIILSFTSGKEVTATTKGTKKTDVRLTVFDMSNKKIGKDTNPGAKCEVKFTPTKDGKYLPLVENSGGPNSVTLEVIVAK